MKNTYDDIDKLLKDMRSDIEDTLSKEVFEEVFHHDIDPDQYVEEKGVHTVRRFMSVEVPAV